MNDDKLRKNIVKILICFSIAFLSLIVYLTYFEVSSGEKVASSVYNKRNKDKENQILRGSIYDRDGDLIVESVRNKDNTQKRVYKEGYEKPYAPVLGYYSSKYGTTGIEAAYSSELLDADMLNPLKIIKDIATSADRKGNNLILTTDSSLQKKAYDALGDNKGAVVAMNPKTGEILCMVSKPTFNPTTIDEDWDKISKQDKEAPLLNRATQSQVYPPGSIFKVIVASKALENISGIESKTFKCNGGLKINNYILHDYSRWGHGNIDIHEAFVKSCNVTFGQIGIDLGADRLKSGAEDFLFNKDLNKEIPNFLLPISKSKFPDLTGKGDEALAQSAIGQYTVSTTPFHMMLIASTFANGGKMMKPYIVKSIVDSYGMNVSTSKSEVLAEPIKKETADTVKDMMVDVVKRGTGTNASIRGISVAGKTGTAEVGSDLPAHSWFIGFGPSDDAQIAIAVILENGEAKGRNAASVAGEVMASYLKR